MEERITGVMIYYYFVCRRKLWYFCHEINMESENEDVQIGKLLDESSYNAYVCEDDSQLLYIQDRATDKTQTITVEPHLATGIMSLEWPDDKMIVAFSHVSPFMGCMSVYDASTQELLLENIVRAMPLAIRWILLRMWKRHLVIQGTINFLIRKISFCIKPRRRNGLQILL